MKAVTLVLALANLVLFGWLMLHPRSPETEVSGPLAAVPGSVERLVLLRERESIPVPTTTPLPAAAEADQGSDKADAAIITSDPVGQSTPAVDKAPSPAASAVDVQPASEAAYDSRLQADATTRCQTVGPFRSRSRAEQLADALAKLQVDATVRATQMEQPAGYWVYLPSMSASDARRTIDQLSAKGVKDYFLGRQNFISLGVYSDKTSAEERRSGIAALGYAPRLEPRFAMQEAFWIDFAEIPDQALPEDTWSELLKGENDIRRQGVACE